MTNVVQFSGISRLPLDPQRVLEEALEMGLTQVVVIGFNEKDNDYFASSEPDAGTVLYHLERAKHRLMKKIDEMTE